MNDLDRSLKNLTNCRLLVEHLGPILRTVTVKGNLLVAHCSVYFQLADPRYRGISVHFKRAEGVKAYLKIKRKSFISKMKMMMTTLPPTHFLLSYNLSWHSKLKNCSFCMLKAFFTHFAAACFGSFFHHGRGLLRNSIFLLEWTTRMPFLPSILSIFNDAHSISPSERHLGTCSTTLSLSTLQFLFPLFVISILSYVIA